MNLYLQILSICLDPDEKLESASSVSFFFFFYARGLHCSGDITHCSCTVHGTHNHFIQEKILKMGPTVLFTYLKIILL